MRNNNQIDMWYAHGCAPELQCTCTYMDKPAAGMPFYNGIFPSSASFFLPRKKWPANMILYMIVIITQDQGTTPIRMRVTNYVEGVNEWGCRDGKKIVEIQALSRILAQSYMSIPIPYQINAK